VSRWANKYVIGLTGNIATGKSVVRKMLQHAGAYTIDADQLAHQAMMPGAPAYKPIIDNFGQFIVGPDKQINRALLGKMVFGNPEAMKKLEAITHPIVRQGVDVLVKRAKQPVVVIEAIKLLEGDLKDWVDSVWVVNASRKSQYIRLVGQRKMSEEDAKQRILSQGAQDEKLKKANVVIENDGDVETTWKQVQTQWNEIRKLLTSAKPAQATGAAIGAASPAPMAAAVSMDEPEPISIDGLKVRSGMPSHAQSIADFITAHGNAGQVSRMDVMMSFGQKSYMLAQDDKQDVLALIGWTVENLVTRMDEFHVKPGVPVDKAIHAIVSSVEERSSDLSSEAAFIFLPPNASETVQNAFKGNGYAAVTLKEIKIPVWREAVEEALREKERIVLWKQLRKDRVLQPI
jgi:dephospho-CoA kinase